MNATRALGEVLRHAEDPRERVLAAWGLWEHDTVLSHAYLDEAAADVDPQVRAAVSRPPGSAADPARAAHARGDASSR